MSDLMFPSSDFEVVPLAQVPAPFGMSHCGPWEMWATRNRYMAPEETSRGDSGPAVDGMEFLTEAASWGGDSAAPPESRGCRSHRHDWGLLTAVAIDMLGTLVPWTTDAAADFAREWGVAESSVIQAVWLLDRPVTVTAGGSLKDGQHRRCAMHVQAVERVPIRRLGPGL